MRVRSFGEVFWVATQDEPNSGLFWPSPVGRPGRKPCG